MVRTHFESFIPLSVIKPNQSKMQKHKITEQQTPVIPQKIPDKPLKGTQLTFADCVKEDHPSSKKSAPTEAQDYQLLMAKLNLL